MYIIITTRNLLWMMLSVCAILATIAGIMTPKWLIGKIEMRSNRTVFYGNGVYRQSYGIYNRCLRFSSSGGVVSHEERCIKFMHTFGDLPSAWGACLVFLCFGSFILGVVVIMSLLGFCLQSIGRKSIFSIGGLMQAIAGIETP